MPKTDIRMFILYAIMTAKPTKKNIAVNARIMNHAKRRKGSGMMKVKVGDKVYVPTDKRPYTVKARDDRYIICTKPFNARHTVLYFIIDLVDRWRAPDNMVFCSGYETDEQCRERLKELQDGTIELSRRRGIPLDIEIE